jgi:hypothetical protein
MDRKSKATNGARTRACVAVRPSERGGAIMEFAVLLPLLLLVACGMADFGRAAFAAIEVESAAQAGAAYGSVSKTAAAEADKIESAVLADLGGDAVAKVESERYCECPDGEAIDCDSVCSADQPYTLVRVSVTMTFETLLDYPGLPATMPIAREAHMRVR